MKVRLLITAILWIVIGFCIYASTVEPRLAQFSAIAYLAGGLLFFTHLVWKRDR